VATAIKGAAVKFQPGDILYGRLLPYFNKVHLADFTGFCSAFAPTAVGTESATMKVTDGPDPLGPYTISFSASATIPESLSAPKMVYGTVAQTASKTLSITVSIKATRGSITLTGASIGGANMTDFSISGSSTCGATVLRKNISLWLEIHIVLRDFTEISID
jgi:hypothetical protein